MKNHQKTINPALRIIIIGLTILICSFVLSFQSASANKTIKPKTQLSPIHPTFPFLDSDSENVLISGKPVSTMNTCGTCHDTNFIESHSFHSDAGLTESFGTDKPEGVREWDTSPGLFGKWNPIQYRYLSSTSDEFFDLGTPEWIMTLGVRHVGGGPSMYSREGNLLTELVITPGDPQTHITDHQTGEVIPWNWQESGIVEMNCFLCHTKNPDNQARIDSLHAGEFGWANTATLNGSGIIETSGGGFVWNPEAFDENGDLKSEFLSIQDPINLNCGLCHGLVHDDVEDPLVLSGCSPERWRTITTGQIISPQRLSDSGMNLAEKEELDRSWDIHAERLLKCTDCHHSLNNPLYYQENEDTRPDHLLFDPRRVDIGEYLEKPLHQFARGDSAQSTTAQNLINTIRGCDSCHATEETHDWLPYTQRHMQAISCEACHIPKIFSSSNQVHDWTVIKPDGNARLECRGVEGDQNTIRGLLKGYEPVWLASEGADGISDLAPYNLLTSFFWIYGDPQRPVPIEKLKAAYLNDGNYLSGIMIRFDANGDDALDDQELIIDTPEKEQFLIERLTLLGLENPRIVGEVQPYSINHTVANGEWVIKECDVCHSENSRAVQGIQLSFSSPGKVIPTFVNDTDLSLNGDVILMEDGGLVYKPNYLSGDLYILGQDNVKWIDALGAFIFFGTFAGIGVHGGLRVYNSMKMPKNKVTVEKVYMYGMYERLWHWLQTFAIVILIFTGLIIHKPDIFGFLQFRGVVIIHNIIAVILGINAFLSLFFHLANGEIKQFIPRPRGFFDQSITQAKYYLQGIFKGNDHPFEKTPEKKLNPLQQLTYFVILNVLLPLQGITGLLIWGAQRWPEISGSLGGLSFLAPFHTMIAWLFAAFIVLHVYLTTTGHTPLTGIKAMMMGWEDVEVHSPQNQLETKNQKGK
jgi:thiosulfate reductase cytochrome b subunit